MSSSSAPTPPAALRHDPWMVAAVCLAYLLLWWVAFFPGPFTVDSAQQWDQIDAGIYQDWHPVFHTWIMGLLRMIWDSPGVVSLTQVVAIAAVMGRLSRSLALASAPRWACLATPLLMTAIPNTATTALATWKDVPFAICVLWSFAEIVALVAGKDKFVSTPFGPARLGVALCGVFIFRQNGVLVGGLILAAVVVALRRTPRVAALIAVISVGGMLAVRGPLADALDAWPTPALFSYTTFVHDMGMFLTEHRGDMPVEDLEFLETILPLDRWSAADPVSNPNGLYLCRQATPLIFAPEFYPTERVDREGNLRPVSEFPPVVLQNPNSNVLESEGDTFMRIWRDAALRWPGSLLRHRLCVSGTAWSPVPIAGGVPLRPPLAIDDPPMPALTAALDGFLEAWSRVSIITWRPAIWIYAGIGAVVLGSRWRRNSSWTSPWLIAVPGLAAWVSVVLFTPGQAYRYVWPAHLCALASLALAARPVQPETHGRHGIAGVERPLDADDSDDRPDDTHSSSRP